MTVPDITLNNGVTIPQLGFGVWQVPPGEARAACATALEVGYRHIDTAEMYGNEQGVGQAVRDSGLAREDVFITSKLNNGFHAHDDALRAFDGTLAALGVERVDLFLIHWPLPDVGDFVETWRAMEEIYRSGRARSIGVSNFQAHHLRRLVAETEVVPAVNQIEIHPFLVQSELRAVNAELGIATEAWSPQAQGMVQDNSTVQRIAGAHDKSPAQVAIRWALQRGDIVFPKSVQPKRIAENFEVFDFELDEVEMADLTALDQGHRTGPDPDTFNWIP